MKQTGGIAELQTGNAEEYVAYWEACGKPPEVPLEGLVQGLKDVGFMHEGVLVRRITRL